MHASPGGLSARASPAAAGLLQRSLSPPSKDRMHSQLDAELEKKHGEVQRTEERLRSLQDDLSATEKKLMNATTELKKISTDRNTPEPFRDDNKYKIRQRLARKMQKVNELRDQATQMESDIDRKHERMTAERNELHRLQSQLSGMDTTDAGYGRVERQMHDKESQINEGSHHQIELQKQLEEALSNITRETSDIKKLEEQLSADQIEQNEELRHELDDIVSGLSGYLENVKGQSKQHKQEFEMLLQEKEGLEEKIRRMEAELQLLEGEANNARWMQKRLSELEDSLRKTEDLNSTLQDEVHRSRQRDPEIQSRLGQAETEAKQLRQTLSETEKKAEAERKALQNQLKTERERAEKMTQRIQDVNRQELETKKLASQLEAAKALNAGLHDQVEEYKHKQQMEEGGFKPSDLKKRLKKFTHEFKTNKNPIEPQGKNDILGMTFQDLQKHTQDQFNNSAKELDLLKKKSQKAESEAQTLREQVKKLEQTTKKEQDKVKSRIEDDNKKLQEEIKRLKKALEEAKERNREGGIPVRIVYRPDSENSADRASSLNSEEKLLFDELQRELLDLKRNMRQHEEDLSKRLLDAEAETAQFKEEMRQKEKEYEAEMEEHRQAAELMREKQEARIQVIAQDLDQAQFVADSLQQMLEEREKCLNAELSNADMSNQMISAQEDELARLYDILETQRDEIENLNQILDHLAQQGPDGVGAAFDDELWRIRQEVNNLKETLAMQSAYVQAMPGVGHMSTQADGFLPHAPGLSGHSGAAPVRANGAAAGTQVGASRPFGSAPTLPSRVSGSQANTTAATVRPGSTAHPSSGPTHSSSGPTHSSRPSGGIATGAAMASTPMPRSGQSSRLAAEPRVQPVEHLGTERRESKAPHGSRSAVGKSGDGLPGQAPHRTQERAFDGNAVTNPSGQGSRRSSRSRAARPVVPSAFERVHRPEPYHPYQTPGTGPTASVGAGGGGGTPYSHPQRGAPTRSSQTTGVQGASRAVQVGSVPGFYPEPVDAYGTPLAPPGGAAVPMVAPLGPSGFPGQAAMGGDPAVAFDLVPQEISYNPGSVLHGFDGESTGLILLCCCWNYYFFFGVY
ncbi:intracellular protein transport protein USO1-like [Aplysia californica]|uniref:Intracellular protein transport protein USO1-like n=1 Tax=Aplysia californica TaxID=6500 RepID=A0ABM1VX77_APLCA|nr:intracellular protein transport protein USO1-like [Aplysia californica]